MTIKTITKFTRKTKFVENFWITMADGVKLSASMYIPDDAAKNKVPALLE